jgi:branched-chain amino acid transport system substrate-binding protein
MADIAAAYYHTYRLRRGGLQVGGPLPEFSQDREALGTTCVSTTFPWQAYFYGRGADPDNPFRSTYHLAWGLGDMAAAFAERWECLGADLTVGCLWNNDRQGHFLRYPRYGFLPVAVSRGHIMIDPGGYQEPATEFEQHITQFLDAGVDVVTSAGTPKDLALFCRQAPSGPYARS